MNAILSCSLWIFYNYDHLLDLKFFYIRDPVHTMEIRKESPIGFTEIGRFIMSNIDL